MRPSQVQRRHHQRQRLDTDQAEQQQGQRDRMYRHGESTEAQQRPQKQGDEGTDDSL